jgi:tRNA(His) guanylyltransferase
MTDKTSIGDRMKAYESVHRVYLTPRLPLVLRLDGVAHHSLTRGMEKPLDPIYAQLMNETALFLCSKIAGACAAYVQSDEISILLQDWASHNTQPWHGKNLQKIVSVSASMAGAFFTEMLRRLMPSKAKSYGFFDSRALILPPHDVHNYFLWRQQDCTRNAILSLGQAHFSHKQLHGKDTQMIREMLLKEKGLVWEDCPQEQRLGWFVHKEKVPHIGVNPKTHETVQTMRSRWADVPAPDFLEDREVFTPFLRPEQGEEEEAAQ